MARPARQPRYQLNDGSNATTTHRGDGDVKSGELIAAESVRDSGPTGSESDLTSQPETDPTFNVKPNASGNAEERPSETPIGSPAQPNKAPDATAIGQQRPETGNLTVSVPPSETKNAVAAPATVARCGNGTFSYAKSHSGACMYRGGVGEWLDGSGPAIQKTPANKPIGNLSLNSGSKIYQLGPRGGCYFINAGGTKTYVDKSLCGHN